MVRIVYNGQTRELERETSIAALLAELDLPTRGIAVEVNLQLVPRDRHAQHIVREGDRIEVVTLVGGG